MKAGEVIESWRILTAITEDLNGCDNMLVPSRIETADFLEDYWANKIDDKLALRPSQNEVLLIVADGACVWDDLEEFWKLEIDHDVMCVNEVATVYPCEFQHFAAGDSHDNDMQAIAGRLPEGVLKHAYNPTSRNFDVRWVRMFGGWSGTTTFFAIRVGLALDYLRIVLAGSPMDNSGHWYHDRIPENDRRRKALHTAHLWKWTEFAARPFATFVRSMSGNTADLLGRPTRDWLLQTGLVAKYNATQNVGERSYAHGK